MESRRRMEGSGIDFWYGVLRSDGGQGARDFWNVVSAAHGGEQLTFGMESTLRWTRWRTGR